MTQVFPHWIESKWLLPKDGTESLGAQLELFNCLGTYEPLGVDDEEESRRTRAELIAYFADTSDLGGLKSRLSALENDRIQLVSLERIPQGDWATAWKKHFKPFALTPEIVIRPSWEEYDPRPGEKVVTLDPGMAFGTGQHDTTRFCAEFLTEIRKSHPHLKSLLDIGCGSGILSLIGKKIGFGPVLGVDIDPAAIETALENLDRNSDLKPVTFKLNGMNLDDAFLTRSDIVVSNIIAETLCELKSRLTGLVNPDGLLVLSGILPERGHLVREAFSDLELLTQKTSSTWHAYLYRQK